MGFSWEELPDVMDVHGALMKQANLKALVKMAKLELEIYQAELSNKIPRNSSVKLVGHDDESRDRLRILLNRLVELESELDVVDAEVKFNSHRIEAAKMLAYKNRI
jgi:hypothetical protein